MARTDLFLVLYELELGLSAFSTKQRIQYIGELRPFRFVSGVMTPSLIGSSPTGAVSRVKYIPFSFRTCGNMFTKVHASGALPKTFLCFLALGLFQTKLLQTEMCPTRPYSRSNDAARCPVLLRCSRSRSRMHEHTRRGSSRCVGAPLKKASTDREVWNSTPMREESMQADTRTQQASRTGVTIASKSTAAIRKKT